MSIPYMERLVLKCYQMYNTLSFFCPYLLERLERKKEKGLYIL